MNGLQFDNTVITVSECVKNVMVVKVMLMSSDSRLCVPQLCKLIFQSMLKKTDRKVANNQNR
jgi:hypothetical protein